MTWIVDCQKHSACSAEARRRIALTAGLDEFASTRAESEQVAILAGVRAHMWLAAGIGRGASAAFLNALCHEFVDCDRIGRRGRVVPIAADRPKALDAADMQAIYSEGETMTDSFTKTIKPVRAWRIDTEGDVGNTRVVYIHESRECVNCHALCVKRDEDNEPTTFCKVLDEFVPGAEWVCPEHQTPGEHRFGLKRCSTSADAPGRDGSPAAFLGAIAWMEHLVKAEGDEALRTPENAIKLARTMLIAPDSYYEKLENLAGGSAAQWRNWALDQVERHDHPQFFAVMREIDEAIALYGRDVVRSAPEHRELFARAFKTAPPRYRAEAEKILAPCIPKATHVNDDGEPVYSLEQLASHLNVPVDEVREISEAHLDPDQMYGGTLHQLH